MGFVVFLKNVNCAPQKVLKFRLVFLYLMLIGEVLGIVLFVSSFYIAVSWLPEVKDHVSYRGDFTPKQKFCIKVCMYISRR